MTLNQSPRPEGHTQKTGARGVAIATSHAPGSGENPLFENMSDIVTGWRDGREKFESEYIKAIRTANRDHLAQWLDQPDRAPGLHGSLSTIAWASGGVEEAIATTIATGEMPNPRAEGAQIAKAVWQAVIDEQDLWQKGEGPLVVDNLTAWLMCQAIGNNVVNDKPIREAMETLANWLASTDEQDLSGLARGSLSHLWTMVLERTRLAGTRKGANAVLDFLSHNNAGRVTIANRWYNADGYKGLVDAWLTRRPAGGVGDPGRQWRNGLWLRTLGDHAWVKDWRLDKEQRERILNLARGRQPTSEGTLNGIARIREAGEDEALAREISAYAVEHKAPRININLMHGARGATWSSLARQASQDMDLLERSGQDVMRDGRGWFAPLLTNELKAAGRDKLGEARDEDLVVCVGSEFEEVRFAAAQAIARKLNTPRRPLLR